MGNEPVEEVVKGTFCKNPGLFKMAAQHYNDVHFWEWMKPAGVLDQILGELEKRITSDLGSVAKMKAEFIQSGRHAIRVRLVPACGQRRQDRSDEDAQRREPFSTGRQADSRDAMSG